MGPNKEIEGQLYFFCVKTTRQSPFIFQLDTSAWKADEDQVYMHVKQGDNRWARLTYGIEMDEKYEEEAWRPVKIYRHFQLYKDDQVVNPEIEGVFENKALAHTKQAYWLPEKL